ncbi:MAG TPA: hypothetical protein VFJ15_10845 [Oleiagrimonas sp.]|nr:hypothetical protein [Oleiagrimonas sp.]
MTVRYSGCADLGVSVTVSKARRGGEPLDRHDLIRAVETYWSRRDGENLQEAMMASHGDSHVDAGTRITRFRQGPDGAFPFGFTVYRSARRISVSWQQL